MSKLVTGRSQSICRSSRIQWSSAILRRNCENSARRPTIRSQKLVAVIERVQNRELTRKNGLIVILIDPCTRISPTLRPAAPIILAVYLW